MGFADRLENFIEEKFNPEEHKFAVKQMAQIKLMEKYGMDRSGTWIDAYGGVFDKLIEDPNLNIVDELEKNETEALAKIEGILYN